MPNYNESTIYKLCCLDTTIEEIYIGSTIDFRHRKSNHKKDYNNLKKNKVYQFIRDNGGWDNWDMILIAKVNCNDRLELRKKEREYMEEYKPSLNMVIAHQDKEEKKEYHKEWYKTNKLKVLTQQKERYETKKEEIHEKAKVKVYCECGSIVRKDTILRHYKTKKHINFIDTI